jgi:hypothetical protein
MQQVKGVCRQVVFHLPNDVVQLALGLGEKGRRLGEKGRPFTFHSSLKAYPTAKRVE